jgi:RNA polymerase sigma-70 factor (ECF subfamily)
MTADMPVPEPVAGEPSLEAFVTAHYRRLIRLAGIVCVERSDAEDAVQNALERAWRNRASLRQAERMKAWLDAILVREAIRLNGRGRSALRRLTRRLTGVEEAELGYLPDLADGFADLIRRLPPIQRAALALHYEVGYSVAETAELMDAPLETTRSRLRLARERLRQDALRTDA